MTVKELIVVLQGLPPRAQVLVTSCSDWNELADRQVSETLMTNHNGYYSYPFSDADRLRAERVVCIG